MYTPIKNFYQSDQWRKLRAVKMQADPLCEHCKRNGFYIEANEVDHITPVKSDRSRMLDIDNLQSLCKSCHSKKTMAENKEKLRPQEKNLMNDFMTSFLK